MKKKRYPIATFLKKHRELDLAYYGKPYDDQDKYQLVLSGISSEIEAFLEALKLAPLHPYIKFSPLLIETHLRKIRQHTAIHVSNYEVTIYHVGSRFGQAQELTGWLNWLEEKRQQHPTIQMEFEFQHASEPHSYQLALMV